MWPINLRVYHPKKHDLRIAYQFGTFPYLTTQVNWLDDFQQHQIKQMENVLWAPYITVLLNARQTGWLGECFGDWVNVYTCEWVSEWMGVLLSERMNRCASEWVNTCACEWVSEWVSGWVGGWVSERVNERVSQWVSEWNGDALVSVIPLIYFQVDAFIGNDSLLDEQIQIANDLSEAGVVTRTFVSNFDLIM